LLGDPTQAGMDPGRVLVLNQTYEPFQVCNARRAVVLLFAGKAERVEDSGRVFRSPSTVFVVPSVIRLQRYVRKPTQPSLAFSKKNILKRDGYTCQYCGRNGGEHMTIDHVIPRAQGGRTVWENVVSACRACNLRKGSRSPDEAGMRLLRRPGTPRSLFYFGILAQSAPPYTVWRKYLPAEADGHALTGAR
jgi:5-methylcytosine-specific restriction endonuclease McrA